MGDMNSNVLLGIVWVNDFFIWLFREKEEKKMGLLFESGETGERKTL